MAKDIIFNLEAREALKKGVDALSDAVKVTLGPKGNYRQIFWCSASYQRWCNRYKSS